jgi:putative salt-induced outer membrane protein YdiY
VALTLLGWPATAQTDEVRLRNGDRLKGSVVRKEGKSLVLKTEALGDVTAAWDQVEMLVTDQPVTVTLAGGEELLTRVEIEGGRATLMAIGRGVAVEDILTLRNASEQRAYERMRHPGLMDLWAGTATLGLAGTQGNAQTRSFTLTMNAMRRTNGDTTKVYLNLVKASAVVGGENQDTAEAVRGGWSHSRTFARRVSADFFNDYEYDRFQNLDLRFVAGGGFGYRPWRGERGRLELTGGGAFNREQLSPPAPAPGITRRSAEAYWGDDYNLRLTESAVLDQKLRVFHNLTETGEVRVNFDLAVNTRLLRWLSWNLGFSNRYLSNPLPGNKRNDLLYTTGIGIHFAR